MKNKLVAFPLCFALVLQGCGIPAQSSTTGEEPSTQETTQTTEDNRKISDAGFVANLQDSVYDLIVDDLDKNGNTQQLEVQEVKAVYLSKEYIEQYSFNSKETKFFGSTLGELEARFGDQKYVFDIDENGKTVCHAVDDFDDTFDQVTKVALVGTGVILISVTILCVTGGAPVTALVACTGPTAGAITANQAHIALMAASTAIAIFDNGDVGEAAKDIAFDTGSDFIMQAIGGVTVA
ncbi:MAG: hypothetical protein Q4B45_03055 [Coriobacteriia bacterium]|nr:hypothetical protein [Coriobacteriia bacterium]